MAASRSSIRPHNDIEGARKHLYDVTIFGRSILTTLTKHNEAITEWINAVNADDNTRKRRLGFEAELYIANNATTKAGTVQFCVGNRCLVIQVLTPSSYPIALYRFLADRTNTFFGVDVASKMELLETHYSFELESVQCTDLGDIAADRNGQPDLRYADQNELGDTVLGLEVENQKPEVVHAHWGRTSKLSDHQVLYACIEAFLNLQIGLGLAYD